MPTLTIELNGVATWVSREGSPDNPSVLLLHGGMADSGDLLATIAPALTPNYSIVAFDRRGHGRTPDSPLPFHYGQFAEETVQLLQSLDIQNTHVIGWSDGGIIALLMALMRPSLVNRLVLIGTNFHHTQIGEPDLSPGSPSFAMLKEQYISISPDAPEHFPVVLEKYLKMARSEPTLTPEEIADIEVPTLILSGDDDLVPLRHSLVLYEALPAGQLGVIPAASHMVPLEKTALICDLISEFLSSSVPPETYLPVRRA